MAISRSHPVRFAALLGAVVGLANTLILEIVGLLHKSSGGALSMLWPSLMFDVPVNGLSVLQTAWVLFIEVAANMAVWTVLLVVPVAVIAGIRSAFRGQKN